MKNNLTVSVIIPVFNEEQTIEACIDSLLKQTISPLEIILVDDGSTDKTVNLIKNKSGVKLIERSHQGPAKARNHAASLATGEILVFMDADMTFDPNFIKELIAPIVSGQVKGTFSKEEYVANWDNVWARCWNYNRGIKNNRMIPEDYPDIGEDFRAILKSEFVRVGGFDDTGYTDTWTLSKKLGYQPKVAEGAKYFHFNPDTLAEVFTQAKWIAKRNYKFGILGEMLILIESSLPVSLVIGLIKSVSYHQHNFVVFKVVYDFGIFVGILEKLFTGKLSK